EPGHSRADLPLHGRPPRGIVSLPDKSCGGGQGCSQRVNYQFPGPTLAVFWTGAIVAQRILWVGENALNLPGRFGLANWRTEKYK
ncbi:hypothetical protein KI387_006495, partial [Taxus chinensis]